MALIHGNDSAWLNRASSPPFVSSNLIVNFDAGNTGSYTAGSDIWYNLTAIKESGFLLNGVGYSSNNNGYLIFDGSDDSVRIQSGTVGDSDNLLKSPFYFSSGEPYTITTWIKPTGWGKGTIGSQTSHVVCRVTTSIGWNLSIGDDIYVKSGVYYRNLNVPGTNTQWVSKDSSISLNTWQNVTVTYDGTNELNIYKNGQWLAGSTGFSFNVRGADFLRIGGNQTTANFPGGIAQVAVYDKVLSSAEILQNFNALKSRYL